MSNIEKYHQVLTHPVMRSAYLSACKYRQIDPETRSVGGKRVGNFKFECTQRLIASIVYDNHQVL